MTKRHQHFLKVLTLWGFILFMVSYIYLLYKYLSNDSVCCASQDKILNHVSGALQELSNKLSNFIDDMVTYEVPCPYTSVNDAFQSLKAQGPASTVVDGEVRNILSLEKSQSVNLTIFRLYQLDMYSAKMSCAYDQYLSLLKP